MTTINQEIFSQITGFEGSWSNGGADQDGYETETIEELISRADGTYDMIKDFIADYEEFPEGEFAPATVAKAVYEFVRIDTGQSADLDDLYIKLAE